MECDAGVRREASQCVETTGESKYPGKTLLLDKYPYKFDIL